MFWKTLRARPGPCHPFLHHHQPSSCSSCKRMKPSLVGAHRPGWDVLPRCFHSTQASLLVCNTLSEVISWTHLTLPWGSVASLVPGRDILWIRTSFTWGWLNSFPQKVKATYPAHSQVPIQRWEAQQPLAGMSLSFAPGLLWWTDPLPFLWQLVWQARLSKQNSGNNPYIFHFLVEACIPHPFTARLPSPWPPRTPYLAPVKWRWYHSICYLALSSRRAKPCVFLQPDIIDCSLQCKKKMIFSNKYLFRQGYREKRLSLSNEGTIRKQETKVKR